MRRNDNINNDRKNIQLFEMGNVHIEEEKTKKEHMLVSGILYGSACPKTIHEKGDTNIHSIFIVKGHMEALMSKIVPGNIKIKPKNDCLFTPGFFISLKKTKIGKFGKISKSFIMTL